MSLGLNLEKNTNERNQRNKSSYIWEEETLDRVKLEIGSLIRPDPYSKKLLKTYIHELLKTYKS